MWQHTAKSGLQVLPCLSSVFEGTVSWTLSSADGGLHGVNGGLEL